MIATFSWLHFLANQGMTILECPVDGSDIPAIAGDVEVDSKFISGGFLIGRVLKGVLT